MCGLSPLAVSRDYSLAAMQGILIVMASLVEHGLYGSWASVVGVQGPLS